jgi:hypothetical protein
VSRVEAAAELRRAGEHVELLVNGDGTYGGWSGHDLLVHLGAYARVVGALLRAAADDREPTNPELYGRELSEAELAITDLDDINHAVIREHAHLSYAEALGFWRSMHQQAAAQLERLTDEQLTRPSPAYPPHWWRPHLAELVTTLSAHYDAHMTGRSH